MDFSPGNAPAMLSSPGMHSIVHPDNSLDQTGFFALQSPMKLSILYPILILYQAMTFVYSLKSLWASSGCIGQNYLLCMGCGSANLHSKA